MWDSMRTRSLVGSEEALERRDSRDCLHLQSWPTEPCLLECSEGGSAAGTTEPPAGLCFGPERHGKSPCSPSGGGGQAECREAPPSCHGPWQKTLGEPVSLAAWMGGPYLRLSCVDLKHSHGGVRGCLIHASSPALGLDLGAGGPCALWNLEWGRGCGGRLCSSLRH